MMNPPAAGPMMAAWIAAYPGHRAPDEEAIGAEMARAEAPFARKPGDVNELRERVRIDSQAFAQMSKAYVISACGTVDEETIGRLELSPEDAETIRSPEFCGGSLIVAPDSAVVAGPLGPEEGILYADLDLELGVRMKLRHDFAGHYNRPDVFQLRVNARAPRIFEVESADGLGEPLDRGRQGRHQPSC